MLNTDVVAPIPVAKVSKITQSKPVDSTIGVPPTAHPRALLSCVPLRGNTAVRQERVRNEHPSARALRLGKISSRAQRQDARIKEGGTKAREGRGRPKIGEERLRRNLWRAAEHIRCKSTLQRPAASVPE